MFKKIPAILKEYHVENISSRTISFYADILKISRILNKRTEINEQDYTLLKYIIENTNCKLDVKDIIKYELKGPSFKSDNTVIHKKELNELNVNKINKDDEFSIDIDNDFNIPGDEW